MAITTVKKNHCTYSIQSIDGNHPQYPETKYNSNIIKSN